MAEINLYHGDCRVVLPTLGVEWADSIVCDPPYELGFMGKSWDKSGIAYDVAMWNQCLGALKPGGYLLAFGGSRTYHRLACAIEDAGFEIRDQIMWLYGSGFPKSHNLEGEHEGKGTALKPAHEPIVVARKPLIGTVLQNVNQYGTGALNIDLCRIEFAENDRSSYGIDGDEGKPSANGNCYGDRERVAYEQNQLGRWPANLIHDGSQDAIDAFAVYGDRQTRRIESSSQCSTEGNTSFDAMRGNRPARGYTDSGSIARFFYCAKAHKNDRHEGVLKRVKSQFKQGNTLQKVQQTDTIGNNHPTVKPTSLMQYLCRLVTPAGGMVFDPFMGSGSTGKGAVKEGFGFTGIELLESHYMIADTRIKHAAAKYKRQTTLFT